ncbi:MAG: hypothetical protein GY833_12140 [Aestuariibacter sp.]|nr:hypothetical protein [Aestuariibacter sp.]
MFTDNSNLRKRALKDWKDSRKLLRVYLDNNISLTGYINEFDDQSLMLDLHGQNNACTLIDRNKILSICSEAYLGKTNDTVR